MNRIKLSLGATSAQIFRKASVGADIRDSQKLSFTAVYRDPVGNIRAAVLRIIFFGKGTIGAFRFSEGFVVRCFCKCHVDHSPIPIAIILLFLMIF
jgi:hypothetical protein